MVVQHRIEMPRSLLRCGVIPNRRMRQRAIESVLRGFEHCCRRPKQRFRVQRGVDRRRKVSGEKVRLQLSRPVIELGEHQIGAVGQATFGAEFAVSIMIQAPELRSQPAQGEDQTELCSTALDDHAEMHPPGRCQAVLAFLLHFREWIPGGEANRDGQQLALGCQILDRKDELVITFPGLFCKKGSARPEILERRVICCREFRAPACDQIQFCDALAIVDRGDEMGAPVELIDDLKYRLLTFFSGRVLGEEHSDAQVRLGSQLLRDQRVRGFLYAVVQEA